MALTYSFDGVVLTLTVLGHSTLEDRLISYERIRFDASVPEGVPVILDVRSVMTDLSEATLIERLRVLITDLRPKLGTAMAMIVGEAHLPKSHGIQIAARELGLRVGLFYDDQSARDWLRL